MANLVLNNTNNQGLVINTIQGELTAGGFGIYVDLVPELSITGDFSDPDSERDFATAIFGQTFAANAPTAEFINHFNRNTYDPSAYTFAE